MKRLKNVESKNEQQLVATIKDQGERQLEAIRDEGYRQLNAIGSHSATKKSHKIEFDNEENQEAKKLVDKVDSMSIENEHKWKRYI